MWGQSPGEESPLQASVGRADRKLHARAAAPSAGYGVQIRSLDPPLVKWDSGSLSAASAPAPSLLRIAQSGLGLDSRRGVPILRLKAEQGRAPKHPAYQLSGGCRNLPKSTGGCFCLPDAGTEAGAIGGGLEMASLMAKTEGSADREEPWVRFLPHPAR